MVLKERSWPVSSECHLGTDQNHEEAAYPEHSKHVSAMSNCSILENASYNWNGFPLAKCRSKRCKNKKATLPVSIKIFSSSSCKALEFFFSKGACFESRTGPRLVGFLGPYMQRPRRHECFPSNRYQFIFCDLTARRFILSILKASEKNVKEGRALKWKELLSLM
jgi:hypothetical protein